MKSAKGDKGSDNLEDSNDWHKPIFGTRLGFVILNELGEANESEKAPNLDRSIFEYGAAGEGFTQDGCAESTICRSRCHRSARKSCDAERWISRLFLRLSISGSKDWRYCRTCRSHRRSRCGVCCSSRKNRSRKCKGLRWTAAREARRHW